MVAPLLYKEVGRYLLLMLSEREREREVIGGEHRGPSNENTDAS